MRVMISNDDGVEAPGLLALARAFAEPEHQVVVVAPREEQSGKSHALTLHEPLRVEPWSPRDGAPGTWHTVRGTPADCVYVGVHHLCQGRPDVVISGVNSWTNLGDDVHYSGTVAAAMEGALMGLPALAVSMAAAEGSGPDAYRPAAELARRVIAEMLRDPLPPYTFLNLNVPANPRGVRPTPMGKRYYHPLVQMNRDPRGRAYYWIGGGHDRFEGWTQPEAGQAPDEDFDGFWFDRGWATLTPLHPDMTARASLGPLSRWALDG